ncbi:hypothetical protein O0544_12345 [Edwardsiella anguillarum]|nr:hypothetical protein [Edwardsiella anguillarum]
MVSHPRHPTSRWGTQAWISDKRIHFNNPTNKVLRLTLDVCPDSDKSTASEGCYSEAILLPGNEKQINVPMGADLNTGKVMFFDLSNQYKKRSLSVLLDNRITVIF